MKTSLTYEVSYMDASRKGLRQFLRAEAKGSCLLLTSVIFTLLWGLIAHLCAFTGLAFSHDSLREMVSTGTLAYYGGTVSQWKVALGRFLEPIYYTVFRIDGTVCSPWLSGVLSLVWLSAAVWTVLRIFDLKSYGMIALISGLLTVNVSVIAICGTFITDLDPDMLAVFLAALGACYLLKTDRRKWLSVPCMIAALGLYQCMISVTLAIVMIVYILRFLNNEKTGTVLLDGLKTLGIMLTAAAGYLLCVKLACTLTGVQLTSQVNGLAKVTKADHSLRCLLAAFIRTYKSWVYGFTDLRPQRYIADLGFVLSLFAGIIVLCEKQIKAWNKILAVLLTALLPFGMNLSCFLNNGAHDLMKYASVFIWILVLLVLRLMSSYENKRRFAKALTCAVAVCISLTLFLNVKAANGIYMKKQLEQNATLSLMTRVSERMEETDGYVPGETPVVFIGPPELLSYDARVTGTASKTPISAFDIYQNYFDLILRRPMKQASVETTLDLISSIDFSAHQTFPSTKFIWYEDNVMVVYMSKIDPSQYLNLLE